VAKCHITTNRRSIMPRLYQFLAAMTILCCCSAAMAQYVWLNEKGVKQYSDVPPPASVPNSKILKAPGGTLPSDAAGASEELAAPTREDEAKKPAAKTLAEQNAEFQKRRTEQAEKEKQAADKAKQEERRKKNCEMARNYERALTSGQRLSRIDANGERAYLSDQERAKEESNNRRALAECK
jgi:type IV secretory pathway VirB10-like protein